MTKINFKNSLEYKKAITQCMGRHREAAKRSISEELYLETFHEVKPAAIANPGPRPPTIGENAQETKQRIALFQVWKYDKEEYTKAMEEDEALKNDMLSICPPEAIDALADPNGGTMHLSAEDVLNRFDATYGVITADTLEACRKNLPSSCDGTVQSVQDVINKNTNYYDMSMTATGQEPPDHEKIYALKALLPAEFALPIALHDNKHKNVKDRKFKKFAAAMILAAGTLAAAGHTAAANSATTVTTVAAAPTTVTHEFLANAIATAITAASKSGIKTASKRKKKPASGKFYCWSHGINKSHAGQDCMTPHDNHDPTANLKNQRGGKTTVWERGQDLGP
jgi:hypothetical protein